MGLKNEAYITGVGQSEVGVRLTGGVSFTR